MTLSELYAQQQRDLEQFNLLRDKAWKKLQEEQQSITGSFGSKENLPNDIRKRFDEQIDDYNKEWATGTGERFNEIMQYHERQRQNITGIKTNKQEQEKTEQKSKGDPVTEKQAEMQKIIAQQQAIRKRQQEHKKKR